MDLKNKKITVLGLSISGISVAKYAKKHDADVLISENKSVNNENEIQIKELNELGIKVEMGQNSKEAIERADIIVTSPGIPPNAPVFSLVKELGKEVISEPDFAYLNKKENQKFITITGTNGKTTTTKLVSEMLINAGFKAPFCGNIGVPPTDLLDGEVEYFVCEISSYQIYHSKYLKPYIGVFINYTPDHVTWHGSSEKYFEDKSSHFLGKNAPEYAILNFSDKKIQELSKHTPSKLIGFEDEFSEICVFEKCDKIFYKFAQNMEKVCDLENAKIFGKHNYQNMMAAVGVAKTLGISNEIIQNSINSFDAPEHRIEFVRELNGIKYYNDSKATNCDSTICALKAFKEKVVLIAGGRDKMTDLTEMCEIIAQKASNVILIGEATERFKNALSDIGYNKIYLANSLEQAVDKATELNQGNVLLSPACASFDMFKSFEDRGNVFKNYVLSK